MMFFSDNMGPYSFYFFSFLLFMEVEHEISLYKIPAELSVAHQLSSAAQRRAVLCRAECCAVLPLSYIPGTIRSIINIITFPLAVTVDVISPFGLCRLSKVAPAAGPFEQLLSQLSAF